MAKRAILHKNKLDDFKKWLVEDGWKTERLKGNYEVLRARKQDHKHPLIIYDRNNANEHYTVLERDAGIISAYLNTRKNQFN